MSTARVLAVSGVTRSAALSGHRGVAGLLAATAVARIAVRGT